MNNRELILTLYEIEAIKFGRFKLKSGILSPIYLDLRVIVSYPKVLQLVADVMWEQIKGLSFDLICGVPYTALPIATAICLKQQKPLVMRRKEVKEYGTKRVIDGAYSPGQKCLIVEDLVTSGKSVYETILPIEAEELLVQDVVVLIDREQGGRDLLAAKGYTLHSAFTLTSFMEALNAEGKLDLTTVDSVKQFLAETQLANL